MIDTILQMGSCESRPRHLVHNKTPKDRKDSRGKWNRAQPSVVCDELDPVGSVDRTDERKFDSRRSLKSKHRKTDLITLDSGRVFGTRGEWVVFDSSSTTVTHRTHKTTPASSQTTRDPSLRESSSDWTNKFKSSPLSTTDPAFRFLFFPRTVTKRLRLFSYSTRGSGRRRLNENPKRLQRDSVVVVLNRKDVQGGGLTGPPPR